MQLNMSSIIRYEPGRRDLHECRYNQNEGYVIFSAMGSFFIPMAVMLYVYVRISCVVAKRHDHMHEIEMHKVQPQQQQQQPKIPDTTNDSFETELYFWQIK